MAKSRTHMQNHGTRRVEASARHVLPLDCTSTNIAPSDEGGDLIDRTIAIWQQRTTRTLSREDGREIIENMTGFFRVLQEWDRAERAAPNKIERSQGPARMQRKALKSNAVL
jgi:hypothetical protein